MNSDVSRKKGVRWNLFGISILGFSILGLFMGSAFALAGAPPAKEEPKYKIEILKMEVVTSPSPSFEAKDLSSKKILMVIAPKDFQDTEFFKPKEILESKGAKITVASTTKDVATGMLGAKVKPDVLLKEVKAVNYDAIVFVGGNGATVLASDPQALALAIEAKKNDKIIGAICISPVILAKAGILEGKKAAVSPWGKNDLKKAGAICTGKAVEIDGKIVTASGPSAAEEFGKALVKVLQ